MKIRHAEANDVLSLARLWHDSWHDAHSALVPESLVRLRPLENFRERMTSGVGAVWIAEEAEASLGFYALNGDELDLLFVSAQWRGKGVAAALLADAERRLREGGIDTAWLACVIGNDRAAKFYEKSGWHRVGVSLEHAETSAGGINVNIWRYEKRLVSA